MLEHNFACGPALTNPRTRGRDDLLMCAHPPARRPLAGDKRGHGDSRFQAGVDVAARYARAGARRHGRSRWNHGSRAIGLVLCVFSAMLVLLQAPAASAYLIKSHLYWERVGAFPHYLAGGQSGPWPKSSLCYNGPDCSKSIDRQCNSDCGNPGIGIQDAINYPKPFLVRFTIDLVVDITMFTLFNMVLPKVGDPAKPFVHLGTFCRDINIPVNVPGGVPDNCETQLPFIVIKRTCGVDDTTTTDCTEAQQREGQRGYLYLQHTHMWDYSRVIGTNTGIALQSGRDSASDGILYNHPTYSTVPQNLTVGFNLTAGRRGYLSSDQAGPSFNGELVTEYPRCPVSPFMTLPGDVSNQGKNPACYCLTARCLTEDENKDRFLDAWTATSMVTFFTDTTTFRMGVTPNTQHHAPRIFAPTVLYLPLLQRNSHGANFSFAAIEGADEDGMTVLEWQHHSSSVLRMSSDGTMTMFPMATVDGADLPWPSAWTDWYKWFMWKVRVIAVDRATVPPVTTTLTMTAKLCTGTALQYVPVTTTDEGITIRSLGQIQTVYVNSWGPSCVNSTTRARLTNFNHTAAACEGFGRTWISPRYHTRADKLVECYNDQPCEFKVDSVKLDFVPFGVVRCKWSDKVVTGAERYCHDLVKAGVGVTHDAFHVTYTGEHTFEHRAAANPGTMIIKPFQGRDTRKNPYAFDIGRREVFCVTSMANDTGDARCPSLPHCVTVLVKGRAPVVTSPAASDTCASRTKADASEFLKGECPDLYACWRSDTVSEITLSAQDADIGETVNIVVDSISTYTRYSNRIRNLTENAYPTIGGSSNGGADVNDHCRARARDPNETPPSRSIPANNLNPNAPGANSGGGGTPPLATVVDWQGHRCGSVIRKVAFDNNYVSTGLSPLENRTTALGHRYTAMGADSIICYTVSDNQARVWGRGVDNRYSRCHVWRLRGAPVFEYNPATPLDTPYGAPDIGGDRSYSLLTGATLTARLSEMTSFAFRARDPNPEDSISVMFLEDPGIPNEAILGPQICVDYGSVNNFVSDGTNTIPRTYTRCSGSICPTIPSPCNEAHRRFSWTPTPGTEGQTYKVCAIAKDSKPECGTSHTRRPDSCPWTTTLQFKDTCVIPSTVGASKRSTLTGFYGSEHCVNIFVTAPNPRWDAATVATEAGVNKLAHVGCDIVWKMSATDLNNYTMRLEVDEDTPLPEGAEMITLRSGVTVAKEFRWTPKRGMEGSFYTVCWRAWSEISYPTQMSGESKYARVRNTDGSRELPKRCVNIKVRRCKYCVQGEDTLLVKMKEYSVDMNWLRLWAANGNDDGDELTTAVEDPGLLGTGMLDGVQNGQLLNIGPIYKFQVGDTMMGIAGRFRTTIKSLLDLNPDILNPETVQPGQEVCLVPCTY